MDNKVTRFLFWLAFMTFLCASIPHVAWIFDQFESGSNAQIITLGSFQFDIWQGLSYLIALSIDALVMWLSFQLSIGKNKVDAGLTWSFILILSALSWYCNWLYSIAHSPASHIDIWSLPLFGGITTVGTFTPCIVSAFPVFSIGYTFMLSRLSKASMTPEELKKHLEARKQLADLHQQYASDESRLASLLKRGIKDVADVGTVAKDAFTQIRQGQVTPVLSVESTGSTPLVALVPSTELARSIPSVTPVLPEISNLTDISSIDDREGFHIGSEPMSETGPLEESNSSQNGSTSPRYIHIDEAVKMLSYDLSYVKSLRTKGVLKTQSKNHDLITVASINAVLSKKQTTTMKLSKASITRDVDTGEMEIQPSLLQSNPTEKQIVTSDLVMSH